jgi:hypothetical protein
MTGVGPPEASPATARHGLFVVVINVRTWEDVAL